MLELLEDGKFTDSLGRKLDLYKYVIIFTSNILEQDVDRKMSPELQSRFSLMYRFSPISESDKNEYWQYKIRFLLNQIKEKLNTTFSEDALLNIFGIDVSKYQYLRKLNKEIMLRISQKYQWIINL